MSLNPNQNQPNEWSQDLQAVSQKKVPCPRPGLEKKNIAGTFICWCLLVLNLYFVVILDLQKSCKDNRESPHALIQISPMLKFYIIMVYLSKQRTTYVYYYQLNSRLDSDFLRFFLVVLFVCYMLDSTLRLIIMSPLSLPICDCV